MIKYIIFTFGILLCANPSMADEHPWTLRIDKQGIKAYTRKVDGFSILEFKADMTIKAPLSEVLAVFEDVGITRQWFYQCTESRLVADENPTRKIVYILLHLPFPVSERDCVFQIDRMEDLAAGKVDYAVVALPDRLPRRPGPVRVPYLKAVWHFVQLADGRTRIEFQQHSDPGGFIPDFISNSLVVDIPYNSLNNLRTLVLSASKKK
ncbi:MAG: START domain-containing protein [Candidatus Omnitrophica bacterium]|nr:START domain-containing protein [Candidatus Omnitrophota bacterium]